MEDSDGKEWQLIKDFVEIDTNVDEIEKKLSEITDKSQLVMMRAMNRTVSTITTSVKKEVSARYFVSQKNVAKTLHIEKSTTGNLTASVISEGSKLGLEKFKVSPLRPVKLSKNGKRTPGVYKAAIKKAGGLKPLTGKNIIGRKNKPFVAIMSNGHTGVFFRETWDAYPIKSIMGPAVPQLAGKKEVMEKVNKQANETLQKRIEHELGRVM